MVAGVLILARELRPPARPMRTGSVCLVAALTLALAAGTLGLGPGPVPPHEFWRAASFETRGGVLGQAELWVSSHLFSTLGASILAVFLFIAGLILVTGATLAGAIRATGSGVAGTGRALRRSTDELRATVARRPATAAARAAAGDASQYAGEPLLPPEPDTDELVVRATHVEAPPIADAPDGAAGELPPPPDGERCRRARRRRRRAGRRRGSRPAAGARGSGARASARGSGSTASARGAHPAGPLSRVDHRRSRVRVAGARRRAF